MHCIHVLKRRMNLADDLSKKNKPVMDDALHTRVEICKVLQADPPGYLIT